MSKKPRWAMVIGMLGGLGSCCWGNSVAAKIDFTPHQELSCEKFISEAIAQDPEFIKMLQSYLKARYAKISSQAIAAWTLQADGGWIHTESASGSFLEPEAITAYTYAAGLQKLFLETGTRLSLRHENSFSQFEYSSNAATSPFATTFNHPDKTSAPVLSAVLIQPLLKNAFGLADRYPVESAELQRQAAAADVREAWENRLAALYDAYFSWLAAYENVRAYQAVVSDLLYLQAQIARKVKVQVSEETDWLRTHENVLRNQAQLTQAEGSFINASVNIAFLRTGKVIAPDAMPKLKPSLDEPPLQYNHDFSPAAHPRVSDLRLMRKLHLLKLQMEKKAAVAAKNQLPDLELVGSAALKGRAENHSGGFDHLNKKDYSIMLQVSYPLGKEQARGELGQAQAGIQEMEQSLISTEQSLSLALFQVFENIQRYRQVLSLNEKQADSSRKKLKLDQNKYRIGRLDTFYLIDSQNDLTNARLQKVQTWIQLQRLRIQYLNLADRLLSQFPELDKRLELNQLK